MPVGGIHHFLQESIAMKHILILTLSLFSLSVFEGKAAFAEPETNLSPELVEFGRQFSGWTSQFGLSHYGSALQASGGGVMFEYIPEGQTFDNWMGMSTITLFTPESADPRIVKSYADSFRSGSGQYAPRILEQANWVVGNKTMYYTEYLIGEGGEQEHNVSIVTTANNGNIIVFQVQGRKGTLSDAMITKFKEIMPKELANF